MRSRTVLVVAFFLANHFLSDELKAKAIPQETGVSMVFEGRKISQEEATELFNLIFNKLVQQGRGDNAQRFLELAVAYSDKTINYGLPNRAWRMLSVGQRIAQLCEERNWLPVKPDSFFVIPVLMAKCAMDETETSSGFRVATNGRKDTFDILKEKNDPDPEALRLLMQHLRCMAGKYLMEQEDLVTEREMLLQALPGNGTRQSLRDVLCRENIRELGTLYLWKYDYKNAERIFASGQKRGDPIAQAKRIICLIYLDRYPEAESLIKEAVQTQDFEAHFEAGRALVTWQQGAKNFVEAEKTLDVIQRMLDKAKELDASSAAGIAPDSVRILPQWHLSLDKMRIYAVQNKIVEARNEAAKINNIMLLWTARTLGSTFEKERLRYREIIETAPFDLGYITLQPKLLADNLALYKGLVADSLFRKVPELKPEKYVTKGYPADLAWDLARVDHGMSEVGGENRDKLIDALNPIDSNAVLMRLPMGTALVDIAKCGGIDEAGFDKEKYVAIIYNGEKVPPIKMVDLGDADKIEALVAEFLALVESSAIDDNLAKVAKKLHTLVVDPWLPFISTSKSDIIICPDGVLSFVNFSALPDLDGKFLGEKLAVSFIGAARDLFPAQPVKIQVKNGNKTKVRVFADPDYKAPWHARLFSLFGTRRSTILNPLPETRIEALAVSKAFEHPDKEVRIFTGLEATEENVRNSQGALVLHLGTHGFFNQQAVENPMRANGLAFAGAFKNFRPGMAVEYQDNPHDGILTAEEISRIDLESCVLVSVSACQSGMGKSLDGEGVLGLRRGFYRSGAANLLLCLWPVGDKEARVFIENFYWLLEKNSLKDVYPKTMAKLLRQYSDEKGIAYAIRAAGPFVMSSVWKPLPDSK